MARKLFVGGWCELLVAGDEEDPAGEGFGVNPFTDMAPAARFGVNPTADNQSVFGFCPRPDKRLDLDLFARVLFLVAGVTVFLPVALFLLLVLLLLLRCLFFLLPGTRLKLPLSVAPCTVLHVSHHQLISTHNAMQGQTKHRRCLSQRIWRRK